MSRWRSVHSQTLAANRTLASIPRSPHRKHSRDWPPLASHPRQGIPGRPDEPFTAGVLPKAVRHALRTTGSLADARRTPRYSTGAMRNNSWRYVIACRSARYLRPWRTTRSARIMEQGSCHVVVLLARTQNSPLPKKPCLSSLEPPVHSGKNIAR